MLCWYGKNRLRRICGCRVEEGEIAFCVLHANALDLHGAAKRLLPYFEDYVKGCNGLLDGEKEAHTALVEVIEKTTLKPRAKGETLAYCFCGFEDWMKKRPDRCPACGKARGKAATGVGVPRRSEDCTFAGLRQGMIGIEDLDPEPVGNLPDALLDEIFQNEVWTWDRRIVECLARVFSRIRGT